MSRPESVSSRMARTGSRTAIWKISFRFFSPPGKALVHRPLHERLVDVHELRLLLHEVQEVDRIELRQARGASGWRSWPPSGSRRCSPRGSRPGTGTRGTPPRARALSGDISRRSRPLKRTLAAGDGVARTAGQHVGERALAGAVRSHDGVHLAGLHREGEAPQDLLVADAGVKVFDLEHRRRSFAFHRRTFGTEAGRQTDSRESVLKSQCS